MCYELSRNDNYLVHDTHSTKLCCSEKISTFPFLFSFWCARLSLSFSFFFSLSFLFCTWKDRIQNLRHLRVYKFWVQMISDVCVCVLAWPYPSLTYSPILYIFTFSSIYRYYTMTISRCDEQLRWIVVQSAVLVSNQIKFTSILVEYEHLDENVKFTTNFMLVENKNEWRKKNPIVKIQMILFINKVIPNNGINQNQFKTIQSKTVVWRNGENEWLLKHIAHLLIIVNMILERYNDSDKTRKFGPKK